MCVPKLKVLAMGKYNVNIITNIYIFKIIELETLHLPKIKVV